MREVYYAKSLEEDFVSKTINGKKKIPFQSVEDMVKNKIIKPNTKNFGHRRRLACTILDKNYLKTYRSQGIIFQTKIKPNFIYPFDVVLLSDVDKIVVQYYRIKDKLHQYYGHKLISGFERFVFRNFGDMVKKFSSSRIAWNEVNNFRIRNGHKPLPKQKYRLVEYNEVIFQKPVKIKPVALFGYRKNSREIARKLGLRHFVSAREFWKNFEGSK